MVIDCCCCNYVLHYQILLIYNLIEVIHKINRKDCDCFLEYEIVKDNLIKYKCLSCNKSYLNKLDEKLKKRFKITFKLFLFYFVIKKSYLSS